MTSPFLLIIAKVAVKELRLTIHGNRIKAVFRKTVPQRDLR